ncbi:MAG: SPOR domain-containing protein [Pseudomonadota bacterium]
MACPAATPFLERLISASGDSKLYCTRGDGTVDGATLPRIIETGKVVGHLADATIVPPSQSPPPVPKGYVRAWKDDRLNTARAQTTAAGSAAQDRVWTREVPSKGVAGDAAVAPVKGPVMAPAKAASGAIYVQVGSFAVASNAEGAADRLSSLGLPVARKGGRINGRAVQVVYAGPFASTSDAQAALSATRRAGFADAFVLR